MILVDMYIILSIEIGVNNMNYLKSVIKDYVSLIRIRVRKIKKMRVY